MKTAEIDMSETPLAAGPLCRIDEEECSSICARLYGQRMGKIAKAEG